MIISRVRGSNAAKLANDIKRQAEKEAEQLMRETRITAKSEALKIKDDVESELKERRREVSL